jgi:hypothetical protein
MEWEQFQAPQGLGSFRVYQVAANQVDVIGSYMLSCLIDQSGLLLDQLTVFE